VTYSSLPGWPLVRDGLQDLAAGRTSTPEALLVLIGAPRLRSVGLEVPAADVRDPDHALYHLLAREDSDSAHSRYNALIRQLVSFERAAECGT
jgi:hypothetical protein